MVDAMVAQAGVGGWVCVYVSSMGSVEGMHRIRKVRRGRSPSRANDVGSTRVNGKTTTTRVYEKIIDGDD